MKQHIVRIILGLAVVAAFIGHVVELYRVPFLDQLDNIIYDARLRWAAPKTTHEKIVILDIDEKSLGQLGRWPWERDKLATLIDKLFAKYGMVVVGFDVVFAEKDTSSGLPVLERLAKDRFKDNDQLQQAMPELRKQLDYDGRFAAALKGKPVVMGYYFSSEDNAQKTGALPAPVFPQGTFAGKDIIWPDWRGYGANLKELLEVGAVAGNFNPLVDKDGVVRRVPMISEYEGKYYESLSLAMFRLLLGQPPIKPGYPPDRFLAKGYPGLEWLELDAQMQGGTKTFRVPVDRSAASYVPYRGPGNVSGKSFEYVSLADVYFDRIDVSKLKGKVGIVGTSAPGLLDLRSTPVGEAYPGVEIHANLLAGMLSENFREKPAYIIGAETLLLALGGIILALIVPLLSPLRATLVSLAAMIAIVALNLFIYKSAFLIIPLAASLLMTIALFALNMSYGYFVESRSKRQFTELFGQYVPPELVDEMARNPEQYSMVAKSEDLSILFSDVRGFTTISESLNPTDLAEYINDYLTTMSLVIRKNRGTLDKYIGDAIMAFWGAPVEDKDHARNAVITGLAMQKELAGMNERFFARKWPEIKIGIGINSGKVRVGDMGSKIRKAYTVMGDPVNLASRLEGRTKTYGVGLMVGEATKKAVPDAVFKELDRIRVKGKDEPVTVYEPICMESELDKKTGDELKLWAQALKMYRSQQWDQAEVTLLNLQRMNPKCGLYETYSEKIAQFRRRPPPPNWAGVTDFDEK